jgi:hypothetical protein
MKIHLTLIAISAVLILAGSCTSKRLSPAVVDYIETNSDVQGQELEVRFIKGTQHNHPTFSIWIEDIEGNFIETLFVTRYVATGIYGHGSLGEGKWDNKPGEAQRPSTLPYWLHKKGEVGNSNSLLPSADNKMPDAITGATPLNDFVLTARASNELPQKFRVMLEINQPWDWNAYWNNTKFDDDYAYKASCQPALVYSVVVDKSEVNKEYFLNIIGHSHYAGQNGELFTDITSLTTAKDIIHKVSVTLK